MEEFESLESKTLESLEKEKSENNKEEMFKSLVLLIEECEKESDYRSLLEVIDEYYDSITNEADKLYIINKKITALLKLEEYNELLKAIEEKDTLRNLSDTEKSNVLFYKAIALEALDEINLAIEALESIEDNISRYSLINKYLKLALLYLKANRYNDAKSAYDYASLVDHSHKNDIFLLVESDLFYHSEKYTDALASFESFFLKSINKYKYLDRYILINTKLKRYDEAYNFYKRFIDKPSLRLSSPNRYTFLKAVSNLLKEMGKDDELLEINGSLESIKPSYFRKEENELFKIISSLTSSLSYPLTKYDKYKNIANKFFKLLNGIEKRELIFVERSKNGYMYSIFNNTQLKEKEISYSYLKENNLYDFFNINEDTELDYYYNNKLERIDSKVKAYVIKSSTVNYGYFIASFNPAYDKIYLTLKDCLVEMFEKLSIITKVGEENNAILDSLSTSGVGYIRIENGYVEFLNRYSKDIYEIKDSIIKYDDFIEFFISPIYPHELIERPKSIIPILIHDTRKEIEFKTSVYNDVIYISLRDVKEENERLDTLINFYNTSALSFKNLNNLKEEIEKRTDSFSCMGLNIPIIEDEDTLSKRDSKLESLYNILMEESKSSILYYLGENHFMYLLYSVDKRTIESLYTRLQEKIKFLSKFSYTLKEKKITGFASKSLKNKTFTEIKDIIEYGFSYSSYKNEFIILDNEEKKDYALYKTYVYDIEKRLKSNSFDIEYYPIIDESNNSIHYFFPKLKMPYDIPFSVFERILRRSDLESRADNNLIEKLFSDAKEFNENLRFIVPVHKESITNPNFIKKFQALYKEYPMRNRIIFYTESKKNHDYLKGIASITNLKIKLATTFESLTDLKSYDEYDIIFISNSENDKFIEYVSLGLMNYKNKEIIITDGNHIENTLSFRNTYKVYTKEKMKSL